MKAIIGAVATLCVVAAVTPASASVHPLGNILPGDSVNFPGVTLPAKSSPPTAFTEEYTFTVVGVAKLLANAAVTVAGVNTSLPTGIVFTLYEGTPAAPGSVVDSSGAMTLPGFVVAGLGGEFGDLLPTGSYFLRIAGTSRGALVLSGNISTTAVPELQTWAMLGIGFAGAGIAMYRSRKTTVRVA